MVASTRTLSVLTTLILSITSFANAHGGDSHAQRDAYHRRHAAAARGVGETTAPPIATPTAPPLSQISSGMPIETPMPLFTTYAAGATPPISGAVPLPSGMSPCPNHCLYCHTKSLNF